MTGNSLIVTWYAFASDIPDALWQECFPPPLEGKWWYETLERSKLEDQFTFLYAVVFEGEKLIAIAPAFVMNVPIGEFFPKALLSFCEKMLPSFLYQRTLFIGSPCSDEGRVGIIPGAYRPAVFLAIHKALVVKAKTYNASMITWKDFALEYSTELDKIAQNKGLFKVTSFPGTIVNISGNKEAYFARLGGKYRYQVKKRFRLSREHVNVKIEVARNITSKTLDEIVPLFEQTYAKSITKFEKLNRAFYEHISAQSQSVFILLREQESDALLAFMLCFQFPDTAFIINKFIGIDYTRPSEWFLYFRLWSKAQTLFKAVKQVIVQSYIRAIILFHSHIIATIATP